MEKAGSEVPPNFVLCDAFMDIGTNNYLGVERARVDFPLNGFVRNTF